MPHKINYFDEAINDIYQIKEWYQIQSEVLKNKFIDSLEEGVNKLENYPTAFSIKFKNFRTIRLNIFPYKIWYYIINTNIIIVAVVHNKRDDKLVKRRIKK